ncbi:MAG: acyl-CoA dehydrogenase family protein [Gordonia sp. (in: high G+C Gram-positive bacteria)]
MDFALSVEQGDLGAAERAWLTRNDPLAAWRAAGEPAVVPISPSSRAHAVQAGVGSLLTTAMGATNVDLYVLAEAHGWAGSELPVAELAVAGRLVEIIETNVGGSVAGADDLGIPVPISGGRVSVDVDGRLVLRATSVPVTGVVGADHVVVLARLPDGADVAAVLPLASVGVRPLATLDLLRSWVRVDVDVTLAADRWVRLPDGVAQHVRDQLTCFRGADALGAAERLLSMTVGYAKQRSQFGQVIGSFQAIKHRCADMALTVEAGRSVLWAAAAALDADDPVMRTQLVSAAAAYVGGGASRVAQSALQIHGGIGFTWEHDVHLLLRRIKVDELLGCAGPTHRRRLAGAVAAR